MIKRLFFIFGILNSLCVYSIGFLPYKYIAKDVYDFKIKNYNNYIGLLSLEKDKNKYYLKLRIFLEDNLINTVSIADFNTSNNINFDLYIDNNNADIVYQGPDNKIKYIKIGSVYKAPLKIFEKDITPNDNLVYSKPVLYKFGTRYYLFYHKESKKNKMDIVLYIFDNSMNVITNRNLTDNFSYAIYPTAFLLDAKNIGLFLEAREETAQNLYFNIFYYKIDIDGNILLTEKLTDNIGDNYVINGIINDSKIYLVWENRLNNWRIAYSTFDIRTNKLSDIKFLSGFSNYKNPRVLLLDTTIYILANKIGSFDIDYFVINGDLSKGSINLKSSIFDLSIGSNLFIIFLYNDTLYISKRDNTTEDFKFTKEFTSDNIVINKRNFVIEWEKINDPSGVKAIYYAFDKNPNTIPDTISYLSGDLTYVNLFAADDGVWYFHIYYEDNSGNKSKILHKKIEIDTIPLFIKEAKGVEFISDVPGQIIREVIVKNLNLIPLLKFYEERKYIQIPFWELPIYLKLKIILSTVILFIVVILLYMLLFIKHKKLVNEYSRVRAIGFDKVYPLEYQGKVIEINPGEFEDVIEGLSDEDKKRHRYIIEAAEKLENEFKKAEPKKSKISTVNLEMSYADIIETKDVLEAVEGLEDITNNIFDFNDDSKILSKRNISEVNIINGYKLNISEAAEVIEEASEVAEAIGEAAEVIEEAGEVVEPIGEAAEVIEEAGEIVEPIGEAAEVIEEAGEVVEAIGEAAEVIEEAGEVVEPIGEAAEVIEEAGEVAEPIEEAAEVVAVKRVDEKITIKDNQDIGKKVLVDKQEKSVSGDKAEKEIIVEKKEEEKEGFGIEKEFKEKVKLRIKYSFFISLLVMITVAISSIINGYFTVKSTKYNLSIENIRKAEILTTSLAISLRDPIRTNDDALIIENLVNTSKIQDILYTQLIKQDIDINDGKLKVFYRDNKGDFKQLLESEKSIINEVISNINKNRMLLIKPDFDTDRLEKQYSLYYPVMISKDRNNLTEKDFGTKVIGIVRIDFSTERIFNVINLEINRIVNATFFIFVIMIGIGILGAITLAYFTVKPIKKLVEGAKIVAGGNLDYKIDIETKDEIGRLTYEFNVMTFKLKEAQEEIIKKKVLEEQFTIAEGIQRSLIPQKDLILKEVDVTGFYKAALGVGGDYFDFFQIDNDKIAVILSDVSGKGIPASLMMVNIRTVFKTYIKTEKNSPSKVVSIINNVLSEDLSSDMFATLFFYIFNKRTRELIFCNAGHGPLTYYSSKTRKVETIKTQTMPIGIMPNNPQYQDVKVSLSPGDIVVVFTDGVTEAMNETREEFTEERLFKIIEENSNLSSKELNAKIIQELANFVGSAPQHDDISLIVMKVK